MSGSLQIGHAQGAPRYFLLGRPLSGGDIVQVCCSGGWITGRFEWDGDAEGPPSFYFSIELDGGGIAQQRLALPERALMRWP